MTEIQDTMSY